MVVASKGIGRTADVEALIALDPQPNDTRVRWFLCPGYRRRRTYPTRPQAPRAKRRRLLGSGEATAGLMPLLFGKSIVISSPCELL